MVYFRLHDVTGATPTASEHCIGIGFTKQVAFSLSDLYLTDFVGWNLTVIILDVRMVKHSHGSKTSASGPTAHWSFC